MLPRPYGSVCIELPDFERRWDFASIYVYIRGFDESLFIPARLKVPKRRKEEKKKEIAIATDGWEKKGSQAK